MKILADNSLPGLKEAFPKPFELTTYNHPTEIASLLPKQEVLLCRSTLKVNQKLLGDQPLLYVATASSGIDHIDADYVHSLGIQIIDARGSNAAAVADYVVASLAYLSQRDLVRGNKAGIIGMGHVGQQVVQRLQALNFSTIVYDPLKVDFKSAAWEDLYDVDLLCLHPDLHTRQPYASLHMINQQFFQQLKPHCVIINAARGGIVDEAVLLQQTKPLVYCTDVYLHEPQIDKRIIAKATLCTPHIAGHSLEAKYAAVAYVSKQLHALAGLPLPQYARPDFTQTFDSMQYQIWQDLVLALYQPEIETQALKQATDIQQAFLTLRKKHHFRHDFARYVVDPKLQAILGLN